MIAFSTSTTIASVGLLVNRDMYGAGGDAMLLALAILSLVASLVVSSVSYGTRARAMESNYKRIQQISLAAENLADHHGPDGYVEYRTLQRDYEVAVDSSENHTEADYRAAQGQLAPSPTANRRRDSIAATIPFLTLLLPAALLIPFTQWFVNGL
jgi:hypothetical protein